MTQLDDEVLERRLRDTLRVVAASPIDPGRTPGVAALPRPRVPRRATAALVAAAIVVVFFVPLPHVSLFHSLVAPAKVTPTNTPMVTSARVTPTEVTGAGGYLWMLGTYPCSTGTCSVVMRSSDGGKSFVRVGTLPAADYRIEFANREDGYAFGSGGGPDAESRLYWTGDGGKTWRFALARFGYSLPQVVVITGGRAYVLVATDCSAKGMCKELASSPVTSDTWTARPLPLTVGEVDKQFGWAVFGSNVWVIMTSGSNAHLLISHNGGRTFSKLTPGGRALSTLTPGGLGALGCNLTATSPTTLWGFCASDNGGDAIRSTDGGRSFVSVPTPGGNYLLTPGGMSNYFSIYPTSDSEAIFYPDSGDVWLTRDGGKHFTSLLRIPHSSEYTCQVALASAKTWLVFAFSFHKPPKSPYLMWRTTNAGRSWQPVKAPSVTTATGVEGTVTGTFVAVGGAAPGLPRPLPGQVTAANTAGRKFTVTVGKSGRFVLSLPAGVYRLTGRSPMFSVNGAEGTCAADQPVRVRAGKKTLGVEVVFPLK